jgi:nitroreductase
MIHAREAFDTAARLQLVGEANIAPSVHNIQPARFRFLDDGAIAILEDRRRRLPVADPKGADNWKSLGAAAEGLAIALTGRGFGATVVWSESDAGDPLRVVARLTVSGDAAPERLRTVVPKRTTWRGPFAPGGAGALDALREAGDLVLVDDRHAIADIARTYDAETLATLRDTAYRLELRSWMRLSRFNAGWSRDGLNARAMQMSAIEAMGADLVLGKRGFGVFDRIGLAGPLIAEGAKVRSAAAVGLFHRPVDEHEFDTGRRFYRLWLQVTQAGLALCPMSVLADAPAAAARLKAQFGLDDSRKLVNVFRIGLRPERARETRRARLPPHRLLV